MSSFSSMSTPLRVPLPAYIPPIPLVEQITVGETGRTSNGGQSGEATAVASVMHQLLLWAPEYRGRAGWAKKVTPESSPVMKAGHMLYTNSKGKKDFRQFASKTNPITRLPRFPACFRYR